MSNCSNCYNGCAEIVSDQCVRYTGIDIPVLGIQNGDSLSFVEQALITFLTSTLDGTGIKPNIDPNIICNLVQQYLPDCGDITATDLFVALIKAACDLQEQIDATNVRIDTIEANYTVSCLSGVAAGDGTHAIVQAIITKLCAINTDLIALALDVSTNYVKKSELCALVDVCISDIPPTEPTQQYFKMVPYTVVEYYGPLTNFDGGGVGLPGLGWEKIYICNGQNGTPDKRGRSPIGIISVPGGGALSPVVDPGIPGNFNYVVGSTNGANTVTLTANQMPVHTHNATVAITDPGHTHTLPSVWNESGTGHFASGGTTSEGPTTDITGSSVTGLTNINVTVANASAGGGQSHDNVHPVLACYYIMYLP
tara:strand:- start:366 stop:1466 length:1101 start_codon:yes stop_codon:yes gene_type:complete